jgi:hypothetical protein
MKYSAAAFSCISRHDEKEVCDRIGFSHSASGMASKSSGDSTLNCTIAAKGRYRALFMDA